MVNSQDRAPRPGRRRQAKTRGPLVSDQQIRKEMLLLLNPEYVSDAWDRERPKRRTIKKARRRASQRRWHLANHALSLTRMKARYRADHKTVNKEHREYYAANRDRIRDQQRDYRVANRIRLNAARRARRRRERDS